MTKDSEVPLSEKPTAMLSGVSYFLPRCLHSLKPSASELFFKMSSSNLQLYFILACAKIFFCVDAKDLVLPEPGCLIRGTPQACG